MLAGFAGFTLAAALAGALPVAGAAAQAARRRGLLRLGPPSLVTLDELAARVVGGLARAASRLGIALGLVARGRRRGSIVADGGAVAAWLVFGAALLAPARLGWRGRRVAYLTLAGFALVAFLGLPAGHFA